MKKSPDEIYLQGFARLNDSVRNSKLVLSDMLIIDMARKGDDKETKNIGDDEGADAGASIESWTIVAV